MWAGGRGRGGGVGGPGWWREEVAGWVMGDGDWGAGVGQG